MGTMSRGLVLLCNQEMNKFKVFTTLKFGKNKSITALHGIYINAPSFTKVKSSLAIGSDSMLYRSVEPLIEHLTIGEKHALASANDEGIQYTIILYCA
jgi:hypothetical protein